MNFTDLLGLVLELVSPVVVIEKLEFARRTRGDRCWLVAVVARRTGLGMERSKP